VDPAAAFIGFRAGLGAGRAFATRAAFRAVERDGVFARGLLFFDVLRRPAPAFAEARIGFVGRLLRERARDPAAERLAFRARARGGGAAFRFAAFFAIGFCAPQLTSRP
jgi:hypothetical protein